MTGPSLGCREPTEMQANEIIERKYIERGEQRFPIQNAFFSQMNRRMLLRIVKLCRCRQLNR
jgi:hypothetical protein